MTANRTPTSTTTFFDGLTTCPTSKLRLSCSTTTAHPPSTGAPASTTCGRSSSPVACRIDDGGPVVTRSTNGARYGGTVLAGTALAGQGAGPARSTTNARMHDSGCEAP